MAIGTSDGEFFENEFDQAAAKYAPNLSPQHANEPKVAMNMDAISRYDNPQSTPTPWYKNPKGMIEKGIKPYVAPENQMNESGGEYARQPRPRTISIIRHGATDYNAESSGPERVRGWGNISLDEQGEQEAKGLGKKLKENPPDVMVSSDLKRAKDTAHIIGQATKTPVELNEGLRTWDIGSYEGKLSKEVEPELNKFITDKPNEKVPGGESFNQFKHRVISTVGEVLDKYPDQHVALVTHSKVDKLIRAWGAAGFNPYGKIDQKEFQKESEGNANVEDINVPSLK